MCAQVQAVIVMPALKKRAAAMKGKQHAKKQKPAKEGVPNCGRLPRTSAKPLRCCKASQRILGTVTADDLSPRCVVRAYEHAGASGSGVARISVTQQASASIESRAMTV